MVKLQKFALDSGDGFAAAGPGIGAVFSTWKLVLGNTMSFKQGKLSFTCRLQHYNLQVTISVKVKRSALTDPFILIYRTFSGFK